MPMPAKLVMWCARKIWLHGNTAMVGLADNRCSGADARRPDQATVIWLLGRRMLDGDPELMMFRTAVLRDCACFPSTRGGCRCARPPPSQKSKRAAWTWASIAAAAAIPDLARGALLATRVFRSLS